MIKTCVSGDCARFTDDPNKDSVVPASLSALKSFIFVSKGTGWMRKIVASIRMASPACRRCAIPLVALIWAIVLGHTSSADRLAARDLTRHFVVQ